MRKDRVARRLLPVLLALSMLISSLTGTVSAADIKEYSEGLALTTENGQWGYADPLGNVVIPIKFQSAVSFTLGVAMVQLNWKLGVIRQDGAYLIQPIYDSLTPIGYGLYIAQKGTNYGVVSLAPISGKLGAKTQELYPITYEDVQQRQADGLDVLVFSKDGGQTVVPMSTLPYLLLERNVPSARFPLIRGRLPSYSDVSSRDWFSMWADLAYNLGLMEGVGSNRFVPNQVLTVAEALKLAAYLESRFKGDDFHEQPITGTPWYLPSVAYCVASEIIVAGDFPDVTRAVTRAEMAKIFGATSLGRTLSEVNDIARVKDHLPDVHAGDYAADAIYKLYAQGVLAGTDKALTFRPTSSITRAEAAAIVSRMARVEQRILLWSDSTSIRSRPAAEPPTAPADTLE